MAAAASPSPEHDDDLYAATGAQPNALERHYGIWSWPTTFLVDRDGTVVSTTLGGENLAAAVDALLTHDTPHAGR